MEQELLKKFQPIVIFDSREIFFPCDIDYYLSNSTCLDQNDFICSDNLNSFNNSPNSLITVSNKKCLVGYNQSYDLYNAPFYGTVKKFDDFFLPSTR